MTFTDDLSGDGAPVAGAALSGVPAPWSCPKQGQGFVCTANLKLDAKGGANASKTFTFSATLGAGTETVKEMKNCATIEGLPSSCATAPLVQGAMLRIDKQPVACIPAAGNASETCTFNVSVTNAGNATYAGPVSFHDLVTSPGFGSITAKGSSSGGWSCIAGTGTGTTDCSLAPEPVTIEPGKSVTASVQIVPGNPLARSFHNCATLTGQASVGSDQPSKCADINSALPLPGEPGKLSVVKTGGSCAGNPQVCSFTIAVANGTDQPINGPVEFTDDLTGDGALFGGATVSPGEPWTCPKEGTGFKCTATLQLDAAGGPNAIKRFSFAASLGAGTGSVKEMKNCATMTGQTPSCATLTLTNGPQLRLEKHGPIRCDLAADKKSESCQFIVIVNNVGPGTYAGPFTFSDSFTPGGGSTMCRSAAASPLSAALKVAARRRR
ncbi:hypothetical protein A7A08_01293 [Methyloligella halotolerans]|uniref:DUF11 domain-containing protein n=1 Tax=Methyloligella halotolerans TaxID=1177755 RepID=A0A1E2S0T8_9HYPH|nr:hypothetical protein [Methyloligella halotolerans]ODA68123.1 hypothetical protein A7A08_01293 [Methyloligella halotolerans]